MNASGWNLAEIWESNADRFGTAPALIHGDRRVEWREFDQRADGLAATLLDAGLVHQAKVAQLLYNSPEYLESLFGLYKAGLVPVNTNYRYGENELVQLWDDADAAAVVFHGEFTDRIARLRARVLRVRLWLWVDDGSGPCPSWAVPFEDAARRTVTDRVIPPWGRSGDDLYLLYTGGTTGLPKGVMWRQDDIVMVLETAARHALPPLPSLAALQARVPRPGRTTVTAAPLMHGGAAFHSMCILMLAGCIVTLPTKRFSAEALLDTVAGERAYSVCIAGDAFAGPLLRALDADPARWDLDSLRVISSSGAMWSAQTKSGLLRHRPGLVLVDNLGSSEAIGIASSTTVADASSATASFQRAAGTRIIDEEGREVRPGSGQRGRVAYTGRLPLGYYKDPEKTAATFVTIGPDRYCITGDWAEFDPDGALRLLGRGSQCINTGGEKVYPEEVEEALKTHPAVLDAAVVGCPDDRFGEAVTAIVELGADAALDERSLIDHVKTRLAGFKAPRRVVAVTSVNRAANGKLDYRALKALVTPPSYG